MSYPGQFETIFNILSPLNEPVFQTNQLGYKLIAQDTFDMPDAANVDVDINLPLETGKRYKLYFKYGGIAPVGVDQSAKGIIMRFIDQDGLVVSGTAYQYTVSTIGLTLPLAAATSFGGGAFAVGLYNGQDLLAGTIRLSAEYMIETYISSNSIQANKLSLETVANISGGHVSGKQGGAMYKTEVGGQFQNAGTTGISGIRLSNASAVANPTAQCCEYALFAIDTGLQTTTLDPM